jgi:hypothetical protein
MSETNERNDELLHQQGIWADVQKKADLELNKLIEEEADVAATPPKDDEDGL